MDILWLKHACSRYSLGTVMNLFLYYITRVMIHECFMIVYFLLFWWQRISLHPVMGVFSWTVCGVWRTELRLEQVVRCDFQGSIISNKSHHARSPITNTPHYLYCRREGGGGAIYTEISDVWFLHWPTSLNSVNSALPILSMSTTTSKCLRNTPDEGDGKPWAKTQSYITLVFY